MEPIVDDFVSGRIYSNRTQRNHFKTHLPDNVHRESGQRGLRYIPAEKLGSLFQTEHPLCDLVGVKLFAQYERPLATQKWNMQVQVWLHSPNTPKVGQLKEYLSTLELENTGIESQWATQKRVQQVADVFYRNLTDNIRTEHQLHQELKHARK